MTFNRFSYCFMLSFFILLYSCNSETTTDQSDVGVVEEENKPEQVDTLAKEVTTDNGPSYLIQEKTFQNITIGSEISAATNVKKGLLQVLEEGAPISPLVAKKVISFFNPQKNIKQNGFEELTAREIEVLQALSDGLAAKNVADKLLKILQLIVIEEWA